MCQETRFRDKYYTKYLVLMCLECQAKSLKRFLKCHSFFLFLNSLILKSCLFSFVIFFVNSEMAISQSGNPTMRSGLEIEEQIFQRARSKVRVLIPYYNYLFVKIVLQQKAQNTFCCMQWRVSLQLKPGFYYHK